MSKSEREKMHDGELYNPFVPELIEQRKRAHELCEEYNQLKVAQKEEKNTLLKELLGSCGENVTVEPPFHCDYGIDITLGDNVFLNFNCVILDCGKVTIGNGTLMGPSVQLFGATHPIDPATRLSGLELGGHITIGSNCWLGGGTIVVPGVTIGDNSVVGAGSVVTKDVPPNVVVVGNPARVIKTLTPPPSAAAEVTKETAL
eukprot:TRINITY_DN1728_c1_g2_i1.p1 TRINITY_DN1728_c1_g2~~TRINITY_DN1728_c1_g2_i1.p1  ORF type:complete len:202 (-),score=27.31 TRINITY_DN1728_c1_g2_i1:265-870(-)